MRVANSFQNIALLKSFPREVVGLPEHCEHKNGRNERDKGGGVSSGVQLLEVGACLKWETKRNMDLQAPM